MITLCVLLFSLVTVLSACATRGYGVATVYADEQWVILPLINNSTRSSASAISESIIESNLRAEGVTHIRRVNAELNTQDNALTETSLHRVQQELGSTALYAVSGTVLQWGREKHIGRDDRVELTLSVHELRTGQRLWTGTKAVQGRGSSSLSSVANAVISTLIQSIDLQRGKADSTKQLLTSVNSVSDSLGHDLNSTSKLALSPTALGVQTVGFDANGFTHTDQLVEGKSTAVFYGAQPPVEELSQFDRLILEPDNIQAGELAQLTRYGADAYAYLSVGEVGPTRRYASTIKDDWVLGNNGGWNSKIMDLRHPGWIDFMLRRVDELVNAGYSGLFLDTMDSYQLLAATAQERKEQEVALGSFIRRLASRHKGLKLISNRGFEVLDTTGPYLEAIAAESLFASWDNAAQRYKAVALNDRNWLIDKLNEAKIQYGLDVIAIDYLPVDRRKEARQVAVKIAELGFTPWVSIPSLDYVGVGSLEVIPRKVILLFDSRVQGDQASSQVHNLIAPLLEYYGYVPSYLDVATEPLPAYELKGRYAGLVSWSIKTLDVPGLRDWIKKQVSSDIPIAMFGIPPIRIDSELAERMGLQSNPSFDTESMQVASQSQFINFENSLPTRIDSIGINMHSVSSTNTVHLAIKDKNSVTADLVVTGEWGGYAATPAASNFDLDDAHYWVTDPFSFLEEALQLQRIPMPDVTTENGNRLWLAHIDGDAFPSWAELPGRRLGAEWIHDRILKRYNMPHSISIVEAEMTSLPAYVDRRKRMHDFAKTLFAMPGTEIATHTFSHPYKWQKVGLHTGSGRYNLNVGNYQYSPEREIGGSAHFINQHLAPAGKQTELMLWSGDALPDEAALATAHNNGLINLNGGFTTISKAVPSVSMISPMARTVGPYVQAYAPIMNENVYTNEWRGPFDGFRRVIETLEMTDKPRRFKPLSIYYHFYAGTKLASLRSLEDIYDWSIAQDVMPVFASYYAKKVPAFRQVGVARYLNGRWKLSALGSIRSIRMLQDGQWPELASSQGIVGARALHDGVYIHTDGSSQVEFKTSKSRPAAVYLVSANGKVASWRASAHKLEFRLIGQVPVELELSRSALGCSIQSKGQTIRGAATSNNTIRFTFTTKDTGNAILNCQA